jgi:hypothetical protein
MSQMALRPRWRLDGAQVQRAATTAVFLFLAILASCYAILFGTGASDGWHWCFGVSAFAVAVLVGGPLAILVAWPATLLAIRMERRLRQRGVLAHLSAYATLGILAGLVAGSAAWLAMSAFFGSATPGTVYSLAAIAAAAAAIAVPVGWAGTVLLALRHDRRKS